MHEPVSLLITIVERNGSLAWASSLKFIWGISHCYECVTHYFKTLSSLPQPMKCGYVVGVIL